MSKTVWLFIASILLCTTNGSRAGSKSNQASFNSEAPLSFLPALRGDYFKYESENVGRPFHIYIRFPNGYDQNSPQRYPVVYLLDGDSLFPILAANHWFLTFDDKLPESIVVGVSYGSFDPEINRRGEDFSTHFADAEKGLGGAHNFHNFLKSELIPEVEGRYRTDPQKRILFGQSRGGSMVLYSAFTDPDLFWGRIASNPHFESGKKLFYSSGIESKREDITLVVTSGTKDYADLRKDALEWSKEWSNRDSKPWKLIFSSIENGTHSANSTDSYRLGMNSIFFQD